MIMPNLTVKDVDSSVAFFQDKLGFRHDMSMAGEDGSNIFAIVGLGAAVFGLGTDASIPAPYAPGVQFMIYLPDDLNIDNYYADVQAKGVQIDEPLKDTYWGDRTFSIHVPDGYFLTFAVTVKVVSVEEMETSLHARNS
jgi:uncharacterized glyoxalase superfamily protein PhnB